MIERDKEYYNQKISELYAVIDNQEKIIRDLQEKINIYENPEDLTLFYMWIDNKAKDKMKNLQQRIDKAIRMLEINIEIMLEQPSNDPLEDEFVIGRYKDLLKILKGE